MTSTLYAVRWVEATGNGDLQHERLFASLSDAHTWLAQAEADDDYGYPSTFFDIVVHVLSLPANAGFFSLCNSFIHT